MIRLAPLVLLLIACPGAVGPNGSGLDCDFDGDGYEADIPQIGCYGNDCDDDNPESYPGAEEICDGLDNDCDGQLGGDLEGEPREDQDNDGDRVVACLDCDDNDYRIGECDE